eukprot:SAG31_NODE_16695_length_699_cov_1.203333_1_plen_118_part_01
MLAVQMVRTAALALQLLPSNGDSPRLAALRQRDGQQAMPRFSWDTIQTFSHCANSSGPLSPVALEYFRNDSFVVIEKSQAISSAPVNRSAEMKMYAAAAQLKARSPGIQVYIYHAVDV